MKNLITVYAVGIGPGDLDLLTPQARRVLSEVSVVAGYRPYLDQIAPLIREKQLIPGTMRQEVERCTLALEAALRGESVAVLSSGDAGVYGMAGLLLELTREERFSQIEIEVIPGITAAVSCAALVGAPFMNDFAVISLSDLMTPAEVIQKRICALASADLPVALYNPASRKRKELLAFAVQKFREYGGDDFPCAVVCDAWRPSQKIVLSSLKEFPFHLVGMTSMVIFGNSQTIVSHDKMFCRRGYGEKYGVGL